MKEYNCPDCSRTDSCTGCQRVFDKGVVTVAVNAYGLELWQKGLINPISIPPSCRECSNHPSNGGSGVCHCVLGIMTIN